MNTRGLGEFKLETNSRVCITVENSPNPSSVYIRLCKHRKKVFYCFFKIPFPREKGNALFMALIKREILTNREQKKWPSMSLKSFQDPADEEMDK